MPGLLKRFTKKLGSSEEDIDIEEYLDTLGVEEEDIMEEEADVWVKPYILEDTVDVTAINDDINNGNVVLLNIEPLYKRNSIKLKQAISEIKGNIRTVDGDIARLSEFKLLITPRGMKVAKTTTAKQIQTA